ncbi:SAM-dependent chlorinase/fluorinase [Candidatus Solincola tengchongensis]|uniref:SAM hydrolase/SAM-dependent halogenase family protein n=1 Tax=Candidatus Solincola tengchongensis TaxID=2900693 RepID=UPI00257A6B69
MDTGEARLEGLITFTSDFGTSEEWVGVVKGVILSINPRAVVVDLSHEIPPFDIGKGALVLAAALPHLPVGVHLAVVDPGVGTRRLAVALQCRRGDFLVGPDNGLLLPAAERLGGVTRAFFLENSDFFRRPVHPTFHARDIFAPVAAHLSLGVDPSEMGMPMDAEDLAPAPWGRAKEGEGAVYATVIDVDRFGSLRLNAYPEQVEGLGHRRGDRVIVGLGEGEMEFVLASTFGEVEAGSPLLFEDSSGVMALGVSGGSLSARTGSRPGDTVIIYGPAAR